MNALATVASFFRDGGVFMYPILAIGVLIVAIVIERLIVIGAAAAINGHKFVDDMVRRTAAGDLMGARNVSMQSHAPVARVAQAMLQHGPGDEARLQAIADDAATLALPPLAKRLPHLNMFANAATLLGLLGTIFGLTTAFSAVGAADPAQRTAFLAAGISQALNTTAFGLIVAVPTLLMHGYLSGMVEGITEQVEEIGIRLSRVLAGHGAARPVARVTPLPGPQGSTPGGRGPVTSHKGAR